jgi:hypothetical protein
VKGKLMNKRKFLILIAPWLVMSCYTVFQHPLVPYVDKLGLDANAYSEEVATLMAEVSAKEDCLRCHSDDLPTVWLREQRTVAANPALLKTYAYYSQPWWHDNSGLDDPLSAEGEQTPRPSKRSYQRSSGNAENSPTYIPPPGVIPLNNAQVQPSGSNAKTNTSNTETRDVDANQVESTQGKEDSESSDTQKRDKPKRRR